MKKKYTIKNKTVSSRSAVLFFIFVLIFMVIIFKLAYLQLYANNKYKIEEYKDSMVYKTLPSKRGDIFDRSGNVLAKSINVYNGYFSTHDYNIYKNIEGKNKDKETEKLNKIFDLLKLNKEEIFQEADEYNNLFIKRDLTEEEISLVKSNNINMLNIDDKNLYFSVIEYNKFKKYNDKSKKVESDKISELFEKLDIDKNKVFDRADRGVNFKIKKSIAPEIAKEIKEYKSSIVSIEIEPSRSYVNGQFAPYVIGHSNENGGQTGIENYFNDYLTGSAGAKRIIRENLNKSTEEVVPAVDGKDLYLTLDSTIQEFVSKTGQEYFEKETPIKLSIIVSDVNNGDILAMESFPKYDLNHPLQGRTDEEKEELDGLNDEEKINKIYSIWRNSAVSDVYEPGSVFKLITAATALEEHTDTLDSTYYCNGFIKDIPGITLRCFRWYNPHGEETFTEAMDNSCNPAFVQMVRKIGKKTFHRYIKGFGFDRETGIELPGETKGIVIDNVNDIGAAELATMSYGHGISVTPIQMITAANAIVNGGYLLQPQITLKNVQTDAMGNVNIKENSPIVKNQIISKATSDKMRGVMEHGVEQGIVKRVASNSIRIGAKSGTTIKNFNKQYDETKLIASFYAAFPIENPKYSVMIVFDEPKSNTSGSSAAGPLAKKIIEQIVSYKQIIGESKVKDDLIRSTSVPDVRGLSLEYASNILENSYLNYRVSANSSKKGVITEQSEYAGKTVDEGTVVELTLSDDPEAKLLVLDFEGKTYQEVINIATQMGYNYKTSGGKGKFVSMNKDVGSKISPDEELILTFED